MIIEALMAIAKAVIINFIALRPDWVMHAPAFLGNFVNYMMSWNAYIPVFEVLSSISLTALYVTAVIAFKWITKLVDWVADIIP